MQQQWRRWRSHLLMLRLPMLLPSPPLLFLQERLKDGGRM
jgi:hypothetical protein